MLAQLLPLTLLTFRPLKILKIPKKKKTKYVWNIKSPTRNISRKTTDNCNSRISSELAS